MKQTLLIILLILSTNSYSQVVLIDVPEEWEIDIWNGSSWTLASENTFTFNNDCLPIEGLLKALDFGGSNMLENAVHFTITFGNDGLPEESLTQLWNADDEVWEDDFKNEITHTGNNLTQSISYDWIDPNWVPAAKEINAYNVSNLITSAIYQVWDETISDWRDSSKTEYTYNANNTLNIVTSYYRNSLNSEWVEETRETYAYTGNLLASKESSEWNGNSWENDRVSGYNYDNNDFLIETFITKWDGSFYQNEERILRTNNSAGQPTEMITESWFNNNWINGQRDRRTYPACQSLSTKEITKSEFTIYPNPAKNVINVNSKLTGMASIIDLNGRLLTTKNIENSMETIDTSKLNSGVYLLIFQNKESKAVQRIVIDN